MTKTCLLESVPKFPKPSQGFREILFGALWWLANARGSPRSQATVAKLYNLVQKPQAYNPTQKNS